MVFQYKEVVVSGTQEGVEGCSAAMAEISTFMQDCGWTLVDDRSAEPATGNDTTHMKYVFSSNGENGEYPTFFVTLYSGISVTQNQSRVSANVHTAYDVGSHGLPASGVTSGSTSTSLGPSATSLNVRSQDDNTQLFMSGDSEMVHIITRREITNEASTTMDNIYFGRFNSFMSVEENPYPLLVNGANGTTITTIGSLNPKGIGGQPPQAFSNNSEMEVRTYASTAYSDAVQPYNLGVDSIFVALPMIVNYDDGNPIRKGVAGTVRNGWISADATNLLNLSILTASGTFGVQEYRSFTQANSVINPSIIVRKS